MKSCVALLLVGATLSAATKFEIPKTRSKSNSDQFAPPLFRRLEDANPASTSSYTFLEDLSSYNTQFGKCIRIKVQENNDDDVQEGNAHFYNGNYHAQYYRYASFYLCSEEKNDQCGSCDYSTEYVTDLDTYLDSSVAYIQTLCGNCKEQCGGGRRALQEADVDCSTCTSTCKLYTDGDANEFDYLNCQKAYEDEAGLQYYSAAACDTNGDLYIGVFYNNACTIKSKKSLNVAFTYNNFKTVQTMCTACADAGEMCGDLYQEAQHCVDGTNMNANVVAGDMPVCKTYKEASTEHTYKNMKKPWFQVPVVLVIIAFLFVGTTMGSYTYYIRHREKKLPLSQLDGVGSSLSDLPVTTSEAVIS
jgi:hypothetical protein